MRIWMTTLVAGMHLSSHAATWSLVHACDVCPLKRGPLHPALRLGLLTSLLAWCTLLGAQPAVELTGEELLNALRGGGYNIYFRHAATDWSQNDNVDEAGDWTSCDPTRMRQLSDEGRRAARAAGNAIRSLGVPIRRVLTSPYCRTVETARLMNLGPVETSTDIMNLRAATYFGGRDSIVQTARERLATAPAPDTNTVLVAHGNVARASTGVYPSEGEGIVFHPSGDRDFEFVGRLTPAQWVQLAKDDAGASTSTEP